MRVAVILTLLAVMNETPPVSAALMFSYDLDSLVYLSSDVIGGELVRTQEVGYSTVWTVTIGEVYSGALSAGRPDPGTPVYLFLAPVGAGPPDPTGLRSGTDSGVKLIRDRHIWGLIQTRNPGPYGPGVDDGLARDLPATLRGTVRRMAAFRTNFAEHHTDAKWPIDQLAKRPNPRDDLHSGKLLDDVAIVLDQAIWVTHDPETIARAGELRRGSWLESQGLPARHPPSSAPATRPVPPA